MRAPHVNYATEESFNTYIDYLALKRHFTTSSYDYHKYNGRVKASFKSYQTRNDAFFFYKLSQRPDRHNLMLANIVANPNIWVRDLCEDRAEEVYVEWKKKTDALTRTFTTDLSKIDPQLQDNFVVRPGSHPSLIERLLRKQISFETFTILAHVTNVFPYWEQMLGNDVVAADVIKTSKKYFPFLEVDKKKFASVLKSHAN